MKRPPTNRICRHAFCSCDVDLDLMALKYQRPSYSVDVLVYRVTGIRNLGVKMIHSRAVLLMTLV